MGRSFLPEARAAGDYTAAIRLISSASSANRSSAVCSHPTPTACLPSALATSRKRRAPQRPRAQADSEQGRPTVLLAERDPYAAEFADYFLRTEGYAVHVVLSAAEAERILDAQPLNVAVVDLMISGGAGLDLCRTIRARASTPILAVSAVDSRDEALDAGVDAFLHKPLEPLRLVSTVRDLIGTSAYLRRGGKLL